MGKLKVKVPKPPRVRDLTRPDVIEQIWRDADRVTRLEAPTVRRRSLKRSSPSKHATA